jgi:hypothetical protein
LPDGRVNACQSVGAEQPFDDYETLVVVMLDLFSGQGMVVLHDLRF